MKMVLNGSHWYEYKPGVEDMFKHFDYVQATCRDNPICYMDSFNYSVMNQNEVSAAVYQFISHRAAVVRDGFEHNFFNRLHIALDMIDWHFILDCITWGLF